MPSVRSAEGKAAQRARNKAAGNVTRSGSSGAVQRAREFVAGLGVDPDQLEQLGVVLGEVTQAQHVQRGAAFQASVTSPADYGRVWFDALEASRGGKLVMVLFKLGADDAGAE